MNHSDHRERLFVYGTLRSEFSRNHFQHLLRQAATRLGMGSFRGKLFDLGGYPGAIFDPESDSTVSGELYALFPGQHQTLFKTLDEYEDCAGHPPQFQRKKIPIDFQGKTLAARAYLLVIPWAQLNPIPTGDYVAYLQKHGWL